MIKKGSLVLLPVPLTDSSGATVQPALVLATTRKHAIVSFVLSTKKQKGPHLVQLPATKTTGLKSPSVIHGEKIASIDRSVILGELGVLPTEIQKRIDTTLKTIFKL